MKQPKIFISAGEPSGDLLAAELVQQLWQQWTDAEIFGICGPHMRTAGIEAIYGIEDLSVMGFVEVLKHLPILKHLEFSLLEQIDRFQPDLAILVDYPGFHLRLGEALRQRGIYVIQYVAPQLWAWGEKRTQQLRRATDEVLGIIPFESKFFCDRDVNYHYVGTPQVDRAKLAQANRPLFKMSHQLTIGFFPGSRPSEIRRLLPKILQIRSELRVINPNYRFAISMAPNLRGELFEEILGLPLGTSSYDGDNLAVFEQGDTVLVRGKSLDLMKSCDSALVTSGTATLECALTGTPMAVVYVMQPLTYLIAKRYVKLPYISLVNLVAEEALVREFIQDFPPIEAAAELSRLAEPGAYRDEKREQLSILHGAVTGDLAAHAARAIGLSWQRRQQDLKVSRSRIK